MAQLPAAGKIFFLLTLLVPLQVQAGTSAQALIDTARSHLEQEVTTFLANSNMQGRYEINIGRLDSRLRMNPCEQELEATMENTSTPLGRVTLRISCNGQSPWSIFVPASVSLYREVVVASRPVKRNMLIQGSDLTMAERDLGTLGQGYFIDHQQVIGNLARRSLQANQVITPNQISAPPMVRRGEQVVIIATSGSISVRMPGEALSDGALGQQIRVRNTRSQKIVHARVIAPGQVEVAM